MSLSLHVCIHKSIKQSNNFDRWTNIIHNHTFNESFEPFSCVVFCVRLNCDTVSLLNIIMRWQKQFNNSPFVEWDTMKRTKKNRSRRSRINYRIESCLAIFKKFQAKWTAVIKVYTENARFGSENKNRRIFVCIIPHYVTGHVARNMYSMSLRPCRKMLTLSILWNCARQRMKM